MQDAVVNGELTITVPEGFKVLDSEGLKELYNDDNTDRWGMMDDQRQMVLSVFWHKNGGLISFLAKPEDVCMSTEKKLSKALKGYGYELEGFYEKNLCGKKACGFRHIHMIKGIEYTSKSLRSCMEKSATPSMRTADQIARQRIGLYSTRFLTE